MGKKLDLLNQKFGRWTVVEEVEPITYPNGKIERKWKCLCECGNIKIVGQNSLRSGASKSCGCYNSEIRKQRHIDLSGLKFGKLTVVSPNPNRTYDSMWNCICECGNTCIAATYHLRSGATQSCGCLFSEKKLIERNKKHNSYKLSGDYGIGYTEEGEEFWFDLEDYDLIKNYYWFKTENGYFQSQYNKKKPVLLLHRLIANVSDDMVVDHIQHQLHDNRKQNLRIATRQQNAWNRKVGKNNTSGYTGVAFEKQTQKYMAYICINGKNHRLGRYKNIDDAIKARIIAEDKYYGEFGYYNSINKNK